MSNLSKWEISCQIVHNIHFLNHNFLIWFLVLPVSTYSISLFLKNFLIFFFMYLLPFALKLREWNNYPLPVSLTFPAEFLSILGIYEGTLLKTFDFYLLTESFLILLETNIAPNWSLIKFLLTFESELLLFIWDWVFWSLKDLVGVACALKDLSNYFFWLLYCNCYFSISELTDKLSGLSCEGDK